MGRKRLLSLLCTVKWIQSGRCQSSTGHPVDMKDALSLYAYHDLGWWVATDVVDHNRYIVRAEMSRRLLPGILCIGTTGTLAAEAISKWKGGRPMAGESILVRNFVFLANRTATQYHRVLVSPRRPSVCLWRCALWLSGPVYMAWSCTSVFLAAL